MWDRKDLKARAKVAFKANYWRCVLVAFVMFALVGGGFASSGNKLHSSISQNQSQTQGGSFTVDPKNQSAMENLTPEQAQGVVNALRGSTENQINNAEILPLLAIVGGVLAVVIAGSSVVSILLYNPLEVGAAHFFTRNIREAAKIDAVERGFTPHWIHNVWTMFLSDLFILLWCLLFIIPGIVKGYAYRMVPYILAEHPEMNGTEVITLSRKMMKGNKWRAFVFDLSFLGWELLGALTAGIVDVFWTRPYKAAANAELYRAIAEADAELE